MFSLYTDVKRITIETMNALLKEKPINDILSHTQDKQGTEAERITNYILTVVQEKIKQDPRMEQCKTCSGYTHETPESLAKKEEVDVFYTVKAALKRYSISSSVSSLSQHENRQWTWPCELI